MGVFAVFFSQMIRMLELVFLSDDDRGEYDDNGVDVDISTFDTATRSVRLTDRCLICLLSRRSFSFFPLIECVSVANNT